MIIKVAQIGGPASYSVHDAYGRYVGKITYDTVGLPGEYDEKAYCFTPAPSFIGAGQRFYMDIVRTLMTLNEAV